MVYGSNAFYSSLPQNCNRAPLQTKRGRHFRRSSSIAIGGSGTVCYFDLLCCYVWLLYRRLRREAQIFSRPLKKLPSSNALGPLWFPIEITEMQLRSQSRVSLSPRCSFRPSTKRRQAPHTLLLHSVGSDDNGQAYSAKNGPSTSCDDAEVLRYTNTTH